MAVWFELSLCSFLRRTVTFLCFTYALISCDGLVLAPVYWNASNPLFKTSSNQPLVEVQLRDEIDFVCPYYPPDTDPTFLEYYVIYQVSRAEFDTCSINSSTSAFMIVNCSAPELRRRFTLIFVPFQSIPNAKEYRPGVTYYFISTSSGTKDGLLKLTDGACRYNNMKLSISVCCQTTPLPGTNITQLSAMSSSTQPVVLPTDVNTPVEDPPSGITTTTSLTLNRTSTQSTTIATTPTVLTTTTTSRTTTITTTTFTPNVPPLLTVLTTNNSILTEQVSEFVPQSQKGSVTNRTHGVAALVNQLVLFLTVASTITITIVVTR